jgi:hypothetical protein
MATPQDYNGGGDAVLGAFFGTIGKAWQANQERIVSQQQALAKQQAADQKELSTLIKNINPNGIQQVDVNKLNSRLTKVYDTYYQANKASSREERLKLRMQLEKDINETKQFITTSKERGKIATKAYDFIADPRSTGLVSSDAKARLQKLDKTPTDEIDLGAYNLANYTQPDTSYLNNEESQLMNTLVNKAGKTTSYGKGSMDGRVLTGDKITTTNLTPETVGTALSWQYNNDSKYRNIFDTQAAQLGVTPDQLLVQKTQELYSAFKPGEVKDRFRDVIPAVAKSGSGSNAAVGSLTSVNLPFADGKGSVQLDEYVPLSIPNKNFAGSQSIDLATGKPLNEPLPSSGRYEVVGITNAPFIKPAKGQGKNPLAGAIAQPNFARNNPNNVVRKPVIHVRLAEDGVANDYFIPYDRLPANVKNSKSIAQALSTFKPATAGSTTAKSTPKQTAPKSTGKKTIQGF